MAQTNPQPGDPDQGETKQRDPSQPRTFAGIPAWALAIVGAGGLAVAAGFIGHWSGSRGSAPMAPVAYAGSPSSATASGQTIVSPGPDGLYPTPTPILTSSGADIFSGSQTPTPGLTSSPPRTSSKSDADLFNPATATPARTSSMATPFRTKTTPQSQRTSTKATTPVAPATSERATRTPSPSKTSVAVDEVKVVGPPSGLTVTTDDLSFGSCPATFRTAVEVEVAYGTSSAAKAKWRASETGAHGSANLQMKGYNSFAGTISGIPTKTAVVLTVVVSGPDGSTTNDPFEITHRC